MGELSESGPPAGEIVSNLEKKTVVEPELTKDEILDTCQKAAFYITVPNLKPSNLHDEDRKSACLQLGHQRVSKGNPGSYYDEDGTFHFPLPKEQSLQENLGIKEGKSDIEGLTIEDGVVSGKANMEDTYTCLRNVLISNRITNEAENEIKQLLETLTSHTLVTIDGEKMTYSDYEKKKKNGEILNDSEISFSLLAKKEVSPDQQTSYSEKTLKPEDLGRLNASAEAIDGELRQVYEPIFSKLNRGGEVTPSERSYAINALSAELILAPTLKEGESREEGLPDVVYQQRLVSKLAVLEALSEDDESVSGLIKEAKTALGVEITTPTDEVVAKVSSKFLAYVCKESGIPVSDEEIASLEKVKVDISQLATMPEADRANFMKNLFERVHLGNLDDENNFKNLFNKVFEKDGSFKERLAIRMSPLLLGSKETFDSEWNNKFSELKPGTLEKIGRFAINNSPPGLMLRLGKSLGRKETYSKQNLIMAGMIFGTLFPQLISSLLSEE